MKNNENIFFLGFNSKYKLEKYDKLVANVNKFVDLLKEFTNNYFQQYGRQQ